MVQRGQLLQSQVLAEARRLEKARLGVAAVAPTPALVDDYDAGQPFPPRADSRSCRMRRARVTVRPEEKRVWWPPYYVRDGTLYEAFPFRTPLRVDDEDERRVRGAIDAEALIPPEPTTESPSADARRRLEETGGRLVEAKLPPTDTPSLLAEIAVATGQTVMPITVNFAPG